MDLFPRTLVGGVSLSRMIIGTNWFFGYSHTSLAKDQFIRDYQTRDRIVDVLKVFFDAGIDTIMAPMHPMLKDIIAGVEDKTGRKAILAITPHFNILPGGPAESEPERVFDACRDYGATFCMPHQMITDALLDKMYNVIRDMDRYSRLIRERGMIPGLSTHQPEAVTIADKSEADVETYIQIYNAIGFMMPLEADWEMRIIRQAKKPVMTIKPMAAGRLLPPVGLAFVWNTLRDQDMVTVGTTTPAEAQELIDLSLDFLNRRIPNNPLQKTRSKSSLD
ncbi:MAG: hypothetical protein AB6733_07150 [Clostridiaceae bacterium]